jgi:hypothetical protein
MKLCLYIGVAVSLLVTAVLAGPVEDYPVEMVSQDMTSDGQSEMDEDYNAFLESYLRRDFESQGDVPTAQDDIRQGMDDAFLMAEPRLPPKSTADLKHQLLNRPKQRETSMQSSCNAKAITHCATIGLQFVANMGKWLGCAGHPCGGAPCPRLIFTGAEWNNCWGEVFQIYRPLGRGDIQSGDFVGLYNSRYSRWFSLYQNRGQMLSCPGSLNPAIGFDHLYKWFLCGGEVFRIYAYGKKDGVPLDEEDDIMLYFPAGGTFGRFPNNGAVGVNTCPRGQLPPTCDKFDRCPENLIKITVK